MNIHLSHAKDWLKEPAAALVAGKIIRRSAAKPEMCFNPATGEAIGTLLEAGPELVDEAVRSAKKSFGDLGWGKREERRDALLQIAALIRRHAEELATLETLANGKLYREALHDDLPETASVFEYYAGWIDKIYADNCPVGENFLNYTSREPVGVCALVTPWNFPLLLAAWKLAPALAMGNTVVLKPSPFTSFATLRLVELIHEKNLLPTGVLNVVLGGQLTGDHLVRHHDVAKVSFTGSTLTGQKILSGAAESNLKLVTLELGGKSPNIIFADVPDLKAAVDRSFVAMFSHKGEKCSEPTRLLVHRSLYPKVLDGLASLAEEVVCGDPFDPAANQGAQCHAAHYQKIMSYIAIGKELKCKLIAGGDRDKKAHPQGLFVRPTIFADVDPHSPLAQDEIFGPVLCVMPFGSDEEAIKIANNTKYGLAAGLWTSDISRAHRVARRLDAGMVFINRYGCYDFASPFGGFKMSGWGKEMSKHSLDAYTKLKSVWVHL